MSVHLYEQRCVLVGEARPTISVTEIITGEKPQDHQISMKAIVLFTTYMKSKRKWLPQNEMIAVSIWADIYNRGIVGGHKVCLLITNIIGRAPP